MAIVPPGTTGNPNQSDRPAYHVYKKSGQLQSGQKANPWIWIAVAAFIILLLFLVF